jgi:SAM-dependent methyltransferase
VTAAVSEGVPALHPTRCAICGTEGNADELWPASLSPEAFTAEVFSARRLPDRLHYRMVRCRTCGLVRSDPVLDEETLARLYEASTFDYAEELEGLRATYGRALGELEAVLPAPRGLLDIGCGNGFVLEVARERGWDAITGVEPSADAIAKAAPGIGPRIVQDVMRPGLFEPESFDAITLFQVLDHIPEPLELLRECLRVLRPGGAILAFNHDVEAWSARLLRSRSPIVDVEHTYLYSNDTMTRLFSAAGFEAIDVGPVRNTYSLAYLLHLVPLPDGAKQRLLERTRTSQVAQRRLTVPLGNQRLIARRP